MDVQRRGTSPPLRSAPTPFSARRSARASRAFFSPTFTRAREPSSPRRLLDPALTPSALQRSQEGCLKRLAGLSKPFKYVVTCNFCRRRGGMHTRPRRSGTERWTGSTPCSGRTKPSSASPQCTGSRSSRARVSPFVVTVQQPDDSAPARVPRARLGSLLLSPLAPDGRQTTRSCFATARVATPSPCSPRPDSPRITVKFARRAPPAPLDRVHVA